MLKGRESLRRIIGKRRRFLPNYSRIISSSTSNSSKDGNEIVKIDDSSTEKTEIKSIDDNLEANSSEKGFVICPVCKNQIRGDDQNVNSHLDSCLARGTKRKLSQRTLFQFSFCSNPRSSKCANEEVHVGIDAIQDTKPTNNDLNQLANTSISEVTCAGVQCEMTETIEGVVVRSSLELDSITGNEDDVGCMEKNFVEGNMSETVDAFSMPNESVETDLDGEGMLRELSGMALETCIVGRKYVDAAEVVSGASISFVRDPSNIKDPNAIKVVSPDSSSGGVLGFLPRELAQHLSPLIDNYQFILEGVITSVPRNSLDIVPIKIKCLQPPSFDGVAESDIPMLKSLYINIYRLMKSGENCPLAPTKYQQNFWLMIEEALRSNFYLFTDDEKSFLGRLAFLTLNSVSIYVIARLF